MPSLTIVHTEASHVWGGQDIRVFTEALWLRDRGHHVHLFSPAQGELYRRAKAAELYCEPVPFTKKTKMVDFLHLVKRFRTIRPDVVCTHSSVDSWVGLLAARYSKVPATIRYRHVSTPVGGNFMNRWQYRGLCDHIVTTAKAIQDQLHRVFDLPRDKVSSIPTGIAPPEMPSREQARTALLKQLRLPETARLVGQVSVLRSWKGQYVLIDAFERLAPDFPDARLVLIGDGPVMGDYSKRARESHFASRIILTGHQEDVWPFYRGLDLAVLASTKNEGIPQSGLQAMFAECPFIGTNVGGIPEIVEHERTGLLVPAEDPRSLASSIIRLLREPELGAALANNALNLVHDRFTLSKMGSQVETLLHRLTAKADQGARQ